jgi:hypothetical protein
MGRLRTREKYLKIKENAHELFYGTSTLLPEKSKSAGLIKKKNRGEKEFKAFNKILILLAISAANLSISRSKIFFILRSPRSRKRF